MSSISEQARFLGVNWHSVWSELRKPWLQAHHWPIVLALTPSAMVRLCQTDGGESIWSVNADGAMRKQVGGNHDRFVAIELPEGMVLRRSVTLPVLSDAEIRQAIEIEVRSSSPFSPDDLRWGYKRLGSTAAGGQCGEVVLGSHRQISALLMANFERLQVQGGTPEVWAKAGAEQYLFLNGYGEQQRVKFGSKGRRLAYVLVAVVAMLLGAIVITPTLQLRARAIEAVNAYTTAYHRAAPLVREREALVRSADQIQILNTIVQEQADPVDVLDALTRVLTDDTSLRSLQIQGLKVNIEGQTGNAAELMQLLGRQPGFRGVVAPTAATRPFGAVQDNFKIEFMLDPKKVADVPPTTGDSAVVPPGTEAAAEAVSPAQPASTPLSMPRASTPKPNP